MTNPEEAAPPTSVAALTRRQVLKTYATPTITVIGLAATGSFATSGRVPLVDGGSDTQASVKADVKARSQGDGKAKGKGT